MKTIVAILALLSAGISIPVRAQWAPDGAGVCLQASGQAGPAAASDGAGGLFVVWEDRRDDSPYTYAQHLDAHGIPLWAPDGIRLCTFPSAELKPLVVSDDAGGAIVIWYSLGRPERIFGQRINSGGSLLWGDEGIPLCTSPGVREHSAVLSDGAGGAFVVFDLEDNNSDVYAQRVAGNGTLLWGGDGVAVCAAADTQWDARAVADGTGGIIIVWTDLHTGYGDIYAQRMNASGSPMWTACGVPVCTESGYQQLGVLVPNGGGGAIIAWSDFRSATSVDIFAQSVGADGVAQWAANGVPVCTAAGNQEVPAIVGDGAAGAIIGWTDDRADAADMYVQRIDSEGNTLWDADGVSICSQPGSQRDLGMVSDGVGGAIAVWRDNRGGPNASDIYAQRVQASGAPAWAADGMAVCTAAHMQVDLTVLADGGGSVFTVWDDLRNGPTNDMATSDIYAARLNPDGSVVAGVRATPSWGPIALMPNAPNPFRENTSFDVVLDHESAITIDVFDAAGRRVRHIGGVLAPRGRSSTVFDGRDQAGNPLASGAYFFRVRSNAGHVTRKITILR